MKSSELWEVLVPCARNDGTPFRTRHHREWDRQVRALAGGLTIFRPAIGQWVGPEGALYKERMIPVRVMCDAATAVAIARRVIRHYDQHAAFIYRVSEACFVVER